MKSLIVALLVLGVLLTPSIGSTFDRAEDLADATIAWQPTRERSRPAILQIAKIALIECARMVRPMPDADRCPTMFLALTFRESSWHVNAVGSRGEVGLAQIHPNNFNGLTAEQVRVPATNLHLAATLLDQGAEVCNKWFRRPDYNERVFSVYGTGQCIKTRGARLLLRWISAISSHERG